MNFVASVYPLIESYYINSVNQALCKLDGKRELLFSWLKEIPQKDYGSCEMKGREQYRATAGWKALLAKAAPSVSKAFTAELKIHQI